MVTCKECREKGLLTDRPEGDPLVTRSVRPDQRNRRANLHLVARDAVTSLRQADPSEEKPDHTEEQIVSRTERSQIRQPDPPARSAADPARPSDGRRRSITLGKSGRADLKDDDRTQRRFREHTDAEHGRAVPKRERDGNECEREIAGSGTKLQLLENNTNEQILHVTPSVSMVAQAVEIAVEIPVGTQRSETHLKPPKFNGRGEFREWKRQLEIMYDAKNLAEESKLKWTLAILQEGAARAIGTIRLRSYAELMRFLDADTPTGMTSFTTESP